MCYDRAFGRFFVNEADQSCQIGEGQACSHGGAGLPFSKQTAARCFPGCRFGDDNGRSSAVVEWAALGRRMLTQVGRARCLSKATAGPASKTIRVLAIMKLGDAVCWCGFRAG